MTELNFSEDITLLTNQRESIVIDGVARRIVVKDNEYVSEKLEQSPILINYGFIKQGNDFQLRYKAVSLGDGDRTDDFKLIGGKGQSANNQTMPNQCAISKRKVKTSQNKILSTYTAKSYPQYGGYGFINYNNDKDSDFVYGINLNKSYIGGEVFSETE